MTAVEFFEKNIVGTSFWKEIVRSLKENGLIDDADKFDYYAEKTFTNADNQTAARVPDDYSPYRYGEALQRLNDSMPILENPFKEEPQESTVSFEELYEHEILFPQICR